MEEGKWRGVQYSQAFWQGGWFYSLTFPILCNCWTQSGGYKCIQNKRKELVSVTLKHRHRLCFKKERRKQREQLVAWKGATRVLREVWVLNPFLHFSRSASAKEVGRAEGAAELLLTQLLFPVFWEQITDKFIRALKYYVPPCQRHVNWGSCILQLLSQGFELKDSIWTLSSAVKIQAFNSSWFSDYIKTYLIHKWNKSLTLSKSVCVLSSDFGIIWSNIKMWFYF